MNRKTIVANVLLLDVLIPLLITLVWGFIIKECEYFGLTKYFYKETILFTLIFLMLNFYQYLRKKFSRSNN